MTLPQQACADCGLPEIWLCGYNGDEPRRFQHPLSHLDMDGQQESFALVFAEANKLSQCKTCRSELASRFSIPTFWWMQYCKRGNGYFGSQETSPDKDGNRGIETWARFLIKKVQGENDYIWIKLNILTHSPSASNQIMLVFDATTATKNLLRESLMDKRPNEEIEDPFWIYYRILNDVVALYDESIWGLRTHVRTIERSSVDKEHRPDYRKLHDLARHAIHIAETTSTTINTIERIQAAHKEYMHNNNPSAIQRRVQDRLYLYGQVAFGLQNRAVATKDRLHNEIQLSFNTVTQQDAATTITISRVTQADSTVMRMIGILTLLFLPATFVSAIFSTSFFNFNPELQKWTISNQFWIYWAWAAPVSVLSGLLFYYLGLKKHETRSVEGRGTTDSLK